MLGGGGWWQKGGGGTILTISAKIKFQGVKFEVCPPTASALLSIDMLSRQPASFSWAKIKKERKKKKNCLVRQARFLCRLWMQLFFVARANHMKFCPCGIFFFKFWSPAEPWLELELTYYHVTAKLWFDWLCQDLGRATPCLTRWFFFLSSL